MSCGVIIALLPAGCTVSDATGKAGSSMVNSIAADLATVMKSLMTFWIKAPDPDLSSGPGSVIAQVQNLTGPIIAFSAIVGIIVAAIKMIRASSDLDSGLNDLTRGLLLMVSVSVAGATVVELLESGFSQLAQYILDKGFNGHDVGQTILKLFSDPTGGGGVSAVIFGVLGIIASAIQYGIMVLRGAILALLVGILPVAAAGALTDGGMQSFKKVCGWISAFVVYRVAAAVIYATAFLMLGSGSSSGILFGMLLVVLSILALPALMRLMPAGAAAMGGGGGGSALGAIAGAAATGSMLLAGGGSRGAAAAMSPTGSQTPGLKNPAGSGGGPGAPGRGGGSGPPGAGGSSGGRGSGGSAGSSGSPSGGSSAGGQAGRPALVGVGGSGGSGSSAGAGYAAGASAGNGAGQSVSTQHSSGQGGGSVQSGAAGGSPGRDGSGQNGSTDPGGTSGSGTAGGGRSNGGGRFDNAMRAVQLGQAAKGAGDAAGNAATGAEPEKTA